MCDKEIQKFVNDMAEAITMLDVTDRQRELIKAALRVAIPYANERRPFNDTTLIKASDTSRS